MLFSKMRKAGACCPHSPARDSSPHAAWISLHHQWEFLLLNASRSYWWLNPLLTFNPLSYFCPPHGIWHSWLPTLLKSSQSFSFDELFSLGSPPTSPFICLPFILLMPSHSHWESPSSESPSFYPSLNPSAGRGSFRTIMNHNYALMSNLHWWQGAYLEGAPLDSVTMQIGGDRSLRWTEPRPWRNEEEGSVRMMKEEGDRVCDVDSVLTGRWSEKRRQRASGFQARCWLATGKNGLGLFAHPTCLPQARLVGPHIHFFNVFAEGLLCARHFPDSRQLLSPFPSSPSSPPLDVYIL